jgi:hypothetical protein
MFCNAAIGTGSESTAEPHVWQAPAAVSDGIIQRCWYLPGYAAALVASPEGQGVTVPLILGR